MIIRQTIIAGICMFLLSIPIRAEVIISSYNNVLTARSTNPGIAGFHGCDITNARKVPAYIFELQTQRSGKTGSSRSSNTCGTGGRWSTISKKESNTGSVDFENIPDGKYRVIVLSGQAIGCRLSGDIGDLPTKAIVYQKEVSVPVRLGSNLSKSVAKDIIQNDVFKVFPNPVSNELTIELQSTKLEGEVTITLADLLGQIIHVIEEDIDKNMNTHNWKIDVQDYPPGTYFINLQDKAGKQFSQKIIIQNNQ